MAGVLNVPPSGAGLAWIVKVGGVINVIVRTGISGSHIRGLIEFLCDGIEEVSQVKIIESELYSLVIEIGDVTYFWLLDGKFDGYDIAIPDTPSEEG